MFKDNLFDKDDSDLTETKRRIGCLIENPAFFENLTAYQNLKYYAIQKGIIDYSQIDKVLDLVKLSDSKNKKFKTFSLGMKQRLGIAFAMLDNPDFVILDEPINGLDPIGISELRETLKKLNEESNITMLISSHILSELYLLANRFCFIEKGKIIKELSKEELDVECSRAIVIKTNNVKETCLILEKELNTSMLEQYLTFQYSVGTDSFFKNVYKLAPGHYFKYKNDKLTIKKYYELELGSDNSKSLEEYVKGIKEMLEDSIKAHKISDVEVGSFLSSGVDSSLMATLADVDKTFTVGYDNRKYTCNFIPFPHCLRCHGKECTRFHQLCPCQTRC